MKKRINYLLAALLVAESILPINAKAIHVGETHSALSTNRKINGGSTTGPAINVGGTVITGPTVDVEGTTTGPAIDINKPAVTVQVTANSITTGGALHISNFKDEYVSIKVRLQGTSLKDPKNSAGSMSSYIASSINVEANDPENRWKLIYSLYVFNDSEFTVNIKTSELKKDSISNVLSFTIPKSLLTTDKDVTVSIPVIYDAAAPNGSTTVTSGPVLASDIAGGRIKIVVRLENTEFVNPRETATSLIHKVFETINLQTLDGTRDFTGPTLLAVNNEKEFVFELQASNVDPSSIQDVLSFNVPGYLLTKGKDVAVYVPVVRDTISKPEASVKAGVYKETQNVTLSCDTPGAVIRYTLDGSNVTLDSPIYKEGTPIKVRKTSTLKAVSFKGTMPSEVTTVKYIISKGSTAGGSAGGTGAGSSSSSNTNSSVENVVDQITNVDVNETEQSTSSVDTVVSVSDTVEKLIKTKERNLNAKVQVVNHGLTINNKKVELVHKLLNSNGRTLVPIRTISEALGLPIQYDAKSKTAIITSNDTVIELPLGYNVGVINGTVTRLDANDEVMSTIRENRAYLPIKFIAEHLNLDINFDGKEVNITSK